MEEISKDTRWYEHLTYKEAKRLFEEKLTNIKQSFIAAGYYLKYIRDNRLYLEDGYKTIWEFAEENYGISRSTASRWMAINDKFSKDGNTPILADEYKEFGKSQLQEMLYLDDKQLEQVSPDMTRNEIRELRVSKKEETLSVLGFPKRTYPEDSLIEQEKTNRESDELAAVTEAEKCAPAHMEKEPEVLGNTSTLLDESKTEVAAVEDIVAEAEYTEVEEEQYEEIKKTDKQLIREILDKEKNMLEQMKECLEESDDMFRKQRIMVGALAGVMCDMELLEEEIEQPELPKLKNMEEREKFVLNYRTWPVWTRNELTQETYYRYELPDGSAIVVREYPYTTWREEMHGKTLFLISPDTKYFKNGETNMTTLKEHLKEVQRGGRN